MDERGIDSGLASKYCIDNGNDTIMFFRKDLMGNTVGFKCRNVVDKKFYNIGKSISIGETLPYLDTNCYEDSNTLLVVEGESDFLLALALSEDSVMCVPGASSFPDEWAKYLHMFDNVVVCSDNDDAGNKLASRIATLCPGAKRMHLAGGKDICDSFNPDHYNNVSIFNSYVKKASTIIPEPVKFVKRGSYSFTGSVGNDNKYKLIEIANRDTRLKRAGHNEIVGQCPFHDDHTPSFSINTEKGLWYCHGCSDGGDVIKYVMKHRDCSFRDAKRFVEEW